MPRKTKKTTKPKTRKTAKKPDKSMYMAYNMDDGYAMNSGYLYETPAGAKELIEIDGDLNLTYAVLKVVEITDGNAPRIFRAPKPEDLNR